MSYRQTTSGYEIHSGMDEHGNSYCIAQGLTEIQAACMVAGPILLRFLARFHEAGPLGPDLKTLWFQLGIEPIYAAPLPGADPARLAAMKNYPDPHQAYRDELKAKVSDG